MIKLPVNNSLKVLMKNVKNPFIEQSWTPERRWEILLTSALKKLQRQQKLGMTSTASKQLILVRTWENHKQNQIFTKKWKFRFSRWPWLRRWSKRGQGRFWVRVRVCKAVFDSAKPVEQDTYFDDLFSVSERTLKTQAEKKIEILFEI